MHKTKISFFVLFFSFLSSAQIKEVRRITEQLCSAEFHGRGYVKKGDSIAAAFLADEFKKYGIAPFNGNYFQSFSLDVNTFPGKMSVSQNGKQLIPGKEFVINPSATGDKTTYQLREITVDDILDLAEIRSIVQMEKSNTIQNTALLIDFTLLAGDTLKKVRGIAQELATVLPVVEVIDTKFTWSVGREQSYFPYLEVQKEVIDKTAPLTIDIEAQLVKNYQSQNVMAYIPAKKKCAKTVMFTAHYDHLGRMGVDTYFPGGNDNASGTAMLFTMANYFKNNPPDFNLLFVAFAGEEAGLVGSEYFVNNPSLKLKKIKFLFNLDIMGSGEDGVTIVNATLFEKEFQLLQDINTEKSLLNQVKSRGPAANSDHYWFTEKGVPAFFMYTMGTNKHYHDIFDTYEALSFAEYNDITTLLIEFVKRLN